MEWILTHLNYIADDICRLKDKNDDGKFDYAILKSTYPMLAPCCKFQPSNILLGMIQDILLIKSVPDTLIVRQLKPQALGQFITQGS